MMRSVSSGGRGATHLIEFVYFTVLYSTFSDPIETAEIY
jgi:hypothetical protein